MWTFVNKLSRTVLGVVSLDSRSFSATSLSYVRQIPAEVAQMISQRGLGSVQLPGVVQQAIDTAATGEWLPGQSPSPAPADKMHTPSNPRYTT